MKSTGTRIRVSGLRLVLSVPALTRVPRLIRLPSMKFELEMTRRGATDEDYLNDLRRCAEQLGTSTISQRDLKEVGIATPKAFVRRFGTWANALKLAGLQPPKVRKEITEEQLFENIKQLWVKLGRQPRYSEIKVPLSEFSPRPYLNRFGTWLQALAKFVDWVNADAVDEFATNGVDKIVGKSSSKLLSSALRRTRRDISDRQRFRILVRDGFRCRSCGASPISTYGIELHVDHVLPWSKGGETVDGNLETKCISCNLGKGNAFDI